MTDPHLSAIATGPACAGYLPIRSGVDRRAPAGAEIDPAVHSRKAQDRVDAKAEARRAAKQVTAAPSSVSMTLAPLEPAAVRVAPAPPPVATAGGSPVPSAFDPTEGADEPIAPQRFGVSKIPQ